MLCGLQVFSLSGARDIFSFSIVYVFVSVSLRTDDSAQSCASLYAILRILLR